MRNRNNHDVTFKKKLMKCHKVFRAFSELQLKYGEALDQNEEVCEVRANVLLKDFELGETFTTDFVCKLTKSSICCTFVVIHMV